MNFSEELLAALRSFRKIVREIEQYPEGAKTKKKYSDLPTDVRWASKIRFDLH